VLSFDCDSAVGRAGQLDANLASGGELAVDCDLAASRRGENFNDDDDHKPRTDDFQTYSVDSQWNDGSGSLTSPVIECRHDVKFIDDDDDDCESGGDGRKEFDPRATATDTTSDEDTAASGTASGMGRRWGTVDLTPTSDTVTPLPSPGTVPLRSIMKSPISPLSKSNKKGISFSQDTVFK